jgi:hypothetical protein
MTGPPRESVSAFKKKLLIGILRLMTQDFLFSQKIKEFIGDGRKEDMEQSL